MFTTMTWIILVQIVCFNGAIHITSSKLPGSYQEASDYESASVTSTLTAVLLSMVTFTSHKVKLPHMSGSSSSSVWETVFPDPESQTAIPPWAALVAALRHLRKAAE